MTAHASGWNSFLTATFLKAISIFTFAHRREWTESPEPEINTEDKLSSKLFTSAQRKERNNLMGLDTQSNICSELHGRYVVAKVF